MVKNDEKSTHPTSCPVGPQIHPDRHLRRRDQKNCRYHHLLMRIRASVHPYLVHSMKDLERK